MTTTVQGTITKIERKRNTVNGNPVFTLTIDNGRTYRTMYDYQCAYTVSFLMLNKDVPLTLKAARGISLRIVDITVN